LTNLVSKITVALDEGDDHYLQQDISDLPRAMAHLFVISKSGEQSIRDLEGFNFPYFEQFRDQIMSEEEAMRLKSSLMAYAEKNEGDYVPTALWTLGYFFDQELIGFLQAQLRVHLELGQPSLESLGQCIIALSTIGEDILLDGSFAAHEHSRNIEMAIAYLDSKA
jgi:hypothetical protein